jgi:small-conductance mechanosensitive channel
MQDIKERFDAEGIEIPFPHRTVYTGAASDPFPIRIVDGKQELVEATGDEDA